MRREGLGYTAFSPLAGGWLTGKYRRGEEPPAGSRMTLRPEPYEHLRTDAVFDALEAFEATAARAGHHARGARDRLAARAPARHRRRRRPATARAAPSGARGAGARPLPARARAARGPLRMSLLVLDEHEVRSLLTMGECIEAMEEVLRSLARGDLHQPLRPVTRPDGADSLMGLMPAYRGGERPAWSLKEIVIAPGNPARGLDAHQGAVLLHDGETGQLRALLNASRDHRDPDRGRLRGRDARARAAGLARRRDPRRRSPGPFARRGDARGARRRRDPDVGSA